MNRFHLLLSVCCAVLVYVCISVFVGQKGIWAYRQLKAQKILLAVHLDSLRQLNEHLLLDSRSLKYDDDVIAAYAKKMGFIQEGERLVRISGMPDKPAFIYDPGTKLVKSEVIFVPEWIAKSIGFLVFVFYNLIYSLIFLKRQSIRYDTAKV